jgi:hypothetical protein
VGVGGLGHGPHPPIPNPQSPIPNPQSPIFILSFFQKRNYINYNNYNINYNKMKPKEEMNTENSVNIIILFYFI